MEKEIRVSIAEDLNEIRSILKRKINESDGMTCISDYEFIDEAQNKLVHDNPDVVVMDIRFGSSNITGIQCMFQVRYQNPKIQFLMFTEYDNDGMVYDALKAGAKGYVLKKDGIEGVISAIRELYDGGSPMNTYIARKVLDNHDILMKRGAIIQKLTPREVEILELVSLGLQNKEIATRLQPQISPGTVSQTLNNIYKKLEVNNRTEAVRKYKDE